MRGRGWVLAAAALSAVGCLSKPALTIVTYSIDPPPPRVAAPPSGGSLLSLETARVAAPYSGRTLLYRTAEHQIEKDPYAVFAAPPGWLLTAAIRGYLGNADFVRDVEEAGGAVPPDARVSVDVIDLYGDLESPGASSAVLTLQFRVVKPASRSAPTSEVLNRTYTRRVPAAQRSAAATVDAWNQGLAEIMKEFVSDLGPALASARTAS